MSPVFGHDDDGDGDHADGGVGGMRKSGIYPETPNIGHLRVDVGLQRLWSHPLVRGRLVASAPVLRNLSINILVLQYCNIAIADAEEAAAADGDLVMRFVGRPGQEGEFSWSECLVQSLSPPTQSPQSEMMIMTMKIPY